MSLNWPCGDDARREDGDRVMCGPGLDQDRDGQRRDHGDLPDGQQQVGRGGDGDARVGDEDRCGQDDQEQHPWLDGHMRHRSQQQRRKRAGQRDTGGYVQRIRADHHPAGQETPDPAQATAVVGVQRASRGQPPGKFRDAVRAAQRRDERDDYHQRRGEPSVGHQDHQPAHHRTSRRHAAHAEGDHPRPPDDSMSQPTTVTTESSTHAKPPSPTIRPFNLNSQPGRCQR